MPPVRSQLKFKITKHENIFKVGDKQTRKEKLKEKHQPHFHYSTIPLNRFRETSKTFIFEGEESMNEDVIE